MSPNHRVGQWLRRRRRGQGDRHPRDAATGRGTGRYVYGGQPGRRADGDIGGASLRVVIAEDNVLLAEGLNLLLRTSGIEVVATDAGGDTFVEAVRQHRPDVTIVDVRLPPSFRDEGLRAALAVRAEFP